VISFVTASRYHADIVENGGWNDNQRLRRLAFLFNPRHVCDQGDPMETTNPQDLLSRMNQIQIEIKTAEAHVEKLKGEAVTPWTAFREREGGFASTLGLAATKKRSRKPLRPGSRSLASNGS
jgi:hypothetical protein